MNEAAEHAFEYQTGHSSQEYREAISRIALAREGRDPAGEWGSAARPAIRMGDVALKPREQATGPVTVRADSVQAQLARARNVDPDGFMARMVQEYDARVEARRTAELRAETKRLECEVRAGRGRSEISRGGW
jgi:hypothetical protein